MTDRVPSDTGDTGGTLPVLYSFRRCPYAMRARMALLASGTVCELREVKLSDKPAAMIEASSKATVPVLVLPGDEVVEESLDIMDWALDRSDPEGWLARRDTSLIAACDGRFKHALDRYKYPDRHDSDPAEHRSAGLTFLQTLDARLAKQPQLQGEVRGYTDIAIMPFVRQFAATDRDWFAAQDLPALTRWLENHLASDLFAACMVRHPPWTGQDAPVTLG